MMHRILILTLALAIISTACGDSPETADGSPNKVPLADDSDTDEDPTLADDSDTDEDPTTEPGPPTASFRGVTEEVIRVGVLSWDWDGLAEYGVEFGRSNANDLYVAALDAINDRGGVNGRMLELYPVEYLPVGSMPADEACVELTDDVQVFVVTGVPLNDQVLCFTEINETAAVVAVGLSEARQERARAPYVGLFPTIEDRTAAFVELMKSEGVFDDVTVGVLGSIDVNEDAFREMGDQLRAIGVEPIEGLIGSNADDLAASGREVERIFERMQGEGVELMISTSGVPGVIANASNSGFQPDRWLLGTIMTGRGLSDEDVPFEYLDGALSVVDDPVSTSAQPTMGDDPLIAACIDDLIERTGHDLSYSFEPEVNDVRAGLFACALARILEEGLTNAGTDLTNDTFQAGLEAIGDIDLAGYSDASISPGDMGAVKGLTLVEFDASTGIWEPVE